VRVFALWHGGSSYSPGELANHLESFASLRAAFDALRERAESNGIFRCAFAYVDREPESFYCPVVDGSEMLVYRTDPRECADPYPDEVLSIGPRGGIRRERA
jgi:hypothetical protein